MYLYRCQRVCSPHCLTCYPSRKPHSARSWLTQCPRWHSHCPQNTRVSPNYRQILRNVCSEIFHTAGLGSLPRVPDSLTQEDPGNSPSLIKTTITKTDNWTGIVLFMIYLTCPSCQWGRETGRPHPWCWSGKYPRSWGCCLLVNHHITVLSINVILKFWSDLYWYIRSSLLSLKVLK